MANFSSNDGKKRNPGAARKWIFGGKCCCSSKKSVQVKEATPDLDHLGTSVNYNDGKSNNKREYYSLKAKASVDSSSMSESATDIHQARIRAPRMTPENNFPATDAPRQQRVSASGGFSFPILNPNSESSTCASMKGIITKSRIDNPVEDPSRDSLEVFQPIKELPSIPRIDNPVIPRQHLNPGSPIARDDDMCSDASSDLFEIESFSTQTTSYPMYRRRDSFEEVPTLNARRFAASNGLNSNRNVSGQNQFGHTSLDEVSIDWSVTNAEARVSNALESGSAGIFRQQMREESCDNGKKKGNGGSVLLLMRCRQEKAVSVGPQPVKCSPAEGRQDFPAHGGGRLPRGSSQSLAFAA